MKNKSIVCGIWCLYSPSINLIYGNFFNNSSVYYILFIFFGNEDADTKYNILSSFYFYLSFLFYYNYLFFLFPNYLLTLLKYSIILFVYPLTFLSNSNKISA